MDFEARMGSKVEIERVFSASSERLYGYWTDSTRISGWMGVPVVIDPKVGGAITIDFGESDKTVGVFKELVPFSRVAFTWDTPAPERTGETLVTITIEDVAPGKARMKLVHSGFKTEKARSAHEEGWNDYFTSWEKLLLAR